MTVTRFFATDKTIYGDRAYAGKPDTFLDIVPKAFKYTRDNFNVNAEDRLQGEQWDKNLELYKELNNKEFELQDSPIYDANEVESLNKLQPRDSVAEMEKLKKKYYDAKVLMDKQSDPEKYKELKTQNELRKDAIAQANLSRKEFERSVSRVDGFTATAATLTGGLGASFTDPLNVATLPLGAGASRSILGTVLIEAGLNAGIEAVSIPKVAEWQTELGQKYGFTDAIQDVGMAALFGGAMGGAVKASQKGARAGLEAIAKNERFPKAARIAAKYLEREAQVHDANPFVDSFATAEEHIEILNRVKTAFEEGKPQRLDGDLDVIDTRGIDPDLKKDLDNIKTRSLSDELEAKRQEFLESEIEQMKLEIQNSKIESGLVDTAEGGKTRFYDNNFPSWYGTLNLKNKDEFFKIIEKKKGVRYNRIKSIADERLRNGYESNTSGPTMPSEEYLELFKETEKILQDDLRKAQKVDLLPERSQIKSKFEIYDEPKIYDRYIKEPELTSKQQQTQTYKQIQSDENLRATQAEIERLSEMNPDEEIVIDYDVDETGRVTETKKPIREILEDLKQDENYQKAITGCAIGKK